ncbi:PAS domain S-box protein [Candidatus Daviesbacteria bacterium]|nr:PAS domain S-box protein [Candidatus Daviesbacteria bacterium]
MKLSIKFAVIIFFSLLITTTWSNFLIFPIINSFISSRPVDDPLLLGLLDLALLLILVVVPMSLMTYFLLSRIVIKPISSFTKIAKIIASGNLGTRLKISSRDEIGELGMHINTIIEHLVKAFQNMAYSLKDERLKERQLAESLEQLRKEKAKDDALLSSIGDGVIAIDKNHRIILFNNAASQLTGFGLSEVFSLPYPNILRIVNEKDQTPAEDFIGLVLSGGNNKKQEHLAILTKDGREIPISYSLGVIYDSDRRVNGVVVVLRDITHERQLDKMKDEFVSIASHELRTPMSAIKNLMSMIFEGDFGEVNEQLKDPLKDVAISTERLIQLVNDMLDVSRLETGRLKIVLEDAPLAGLVDEIVKLMQSLAQETGNHISVGSIDQSMVRTDVSKFKEILSNLIGNALKFTDKGQISISTKRQGSYIFVSVSDTGIGIAEEDKAKLFGKFSQIGTGALVRPPGTGLGLYISREFARKMGGDLWLESSGEGKGSTFTFSVPVADQASQQSVIEDTSFIQA